MSGGGAVPAADGEASLPVLWRVRGCEHDLSDRGRIMGVINVTPDSFSDGGRFQEPEAAVEQGLRLLEEGADILDVGGESTRPGSEPVPPQEQIRRVLPVIRGLRRRTDAWISVDTTRAEVAEAALEAGADIINDISGLRADPAMLPLAARCGAAIVIMHMQGEPRTMQRSPRYDDVVAEVREFFRQRLAAAAAAGLHPAAAALDPGIGFGKTLEHNLQLLRGLCALRVENRPLLLGVSRKSFLGRILGSEDLAHRHWPTVALTSLGRERGARLFRVHDARPNVEALKMTEAILRAGFAGERA